jgi:hypothetical protein
MREKHAQRKNMVLGRVAAPELKKNMASAVMRVRRKYS